MNIDHEDNKKNAEFRPRALQESQISLNNQISFHENFHIKLIVNDQEEPVKLTLIKESDYAEGIIPYENLIDLLKRDHPFEAVPECRIKYLDERTDDYYILKKGKSLDPHNFKRGFVEIKLEKDKRGLTKHMSDDLAESGNYRMSREKDNQRIEQLEGELFRMKNDIGKMKIIISAILKSCGPLNEEFLRIVKFFYSPDELERLEIVQEEDINDIDAMEEPVLRRERSLLPELKIIEQISLGVENKQGSFRATESAKIDSIDFGILYSHPLVVKISRQGKTYTSPLTSDPVDFAGECNEILKSFKLEGKNLKCHIECATLDKLTKLIEHKPKILHICCHGEYDKDLGEYYLEFENERAELLKLTPSALRDMLKGDDLSEIKLAFVNACHSEAVARVFFEFGITCIVVVSSRHKINDIFAKNFSNLFYKELMKEKTINEAYNKAKTQLKAMHLNSSDSCCCGHAHKPDCEWQRQVKLVGINQAHCYHVPCCDCPKADYGIHNHECTWFDDLEMVPYEVQLEYLDDDREEMRVCCCSPELSHDEIMKLKLIYKDDDQLHGDKIVFKNLRNGSVKQVNTHFFAGTQFRDCNMMGNKRLLYEMFNAVANDGVRILYLKGERESGKTMVSKFFANYCEERHKVEDVKYINMENTSSVHVFLAKIPNYFGTGISNKMSYTYGEGTLIILDNMDILLNNYFKEFDKKINEIIGQTNLKFLIISVDDEFLSGKVFGSFERTMSVGKLDSMIAAKMLIKMKKNYLNLVYRNPIELSKHPIFSEASNSPRRVSNIAFLLSKGYDLDTVGSKLQKEEDEDQDPKNREADKEKRIFIE